MKIAGVCLSVATIALSVVGMSFVSKIVEAGGSGYAWEYLPGVSGLAIGIASLIFWVWRIASCWK